MAGRAGVRLAPQLPAAGNAEGIPRREFPRHGPAWMPQNPVAAFMRWLLECDHPLAGLHFRSSRLPQPGRVGRYAVTVSPAIRRRRILARREQAVRASPAAQPHKRDARRTGPAQLQPWPARRAGARAKFRQAPAQPGREAVSKMVNRPFPTVSHGALTPGKAPRRWSGVPADCFLRPLRVGRRAVTASTDSACGLMAGTTGLEPATSDVTGRRSNQLNYVPALGGPNGCEWWAITDSNRGPSACKADALTN